MDPATYATRSRATVQCTARAVRPPDGDPVVPRSHADASAGHVGAALRVARARAWRLFRLWTATQRAGKIGETSSEGVAQRRHAESVTQNRRRTRRFCRFGALRDTFSQACALSEGCAGGAMKVWSC